MAHHANCKTGRMPRLSEPSPYVEFDRSQWRALRMSTPLKLSEDEVLKLRGLGEKLDLLEVEEVYLPLARLIHLQVAARQRLFATTAEFLGEPQQNPDRPVPFVIGVAGSVAVGKSTTARVLQALLGPLGTSSAGRPRHHRRIPLPERRTVPTKHDAPQGFSGKLRPSRVDAVRHVGEVGRRSGLRAGVFASALRHRARREADHPPPGHPHPRGAQRAADGADADGLGPVRLLGVRRRAHRRHRTVVRHTVSRPSRPPRSPIRRRTSTTTPRSPTTRRSSLPATSGIPSTVPT